MEPRTEFVRQNSLRRCGKRDGPKVTLSDTNKLQLAVKTCLNSKVVSQHSDILAPIAVKAVQSICDKAVPDNVDLRNIRVVGAVGATVDETELVPGIVFRQHAHSGENQKKENAKIGMAQFQLSAPK